MPLLGRRQFVLGLGAALRLQSSEPPFWNAKSPAEWTVGDKYQLCNRSPWANPVRGFARPPQNWRLESRGMDGVPAPAIWGPKGVVTWESALPVREALKAALPREFGNAYVLGVDGITFGGGRPDFLRRGTVLRSKGEIKWMVRASLVRETVRNSSVILFAFPRAAAPIGPDTGDVLFEAQFGRWTIETRFKPREMIYQGQLAL